MPPTHLPIYVASLGPANLRLTGELADGWIGTSFFPETADVFLDPIREGAARAGRDIADLDLTVAVGVEFTDDVEAAGRRHAEGYAFTIGAMGSAGDELLQQRVRTAGLRRRHPRGPTTLARRRQGRRPSTSPHRDRARHQPHRHRRPRPRPPAPLPRRRHHHPARQPPRRPRRRPRPPARRPRTTARPRAPGQRRALDVGERVNQLVKRTTTREATRWRTDEAGPAVKRPPPRDGSSAGCRFGVHGVDRPTGCAELAGDVARSFADVVLQRRGAAATPRIATRRRWRRPRRRWRRRSGRRGSTHRARPRRVRSRRRCGATSARCSASRVGSTMVSPVMLRKRAAARPEAWGGRRGAPCRARWRGRGRRSRPRASAGCRRGGARGARR